MQWIEFCCARRTGSLPARASACLTLSDVLDHKAESCMNWQLRSKIPAMWVRAHVPSSSSAGMSPESSPGPKSPPGQQALGRLRPPAQQVVRLSVPSDPPQELHKVGTREQKVQWLAEWRRQHRRRRLERHRTSVHAHVFVRRDGAACDVALWGPHAVPPLPPQRTPGT